MLKKFLIFVVFLAVAAAAIWFVWFHQEHEPGEEKKPEADVPVHTGKIARATLRSYVVAYGTVEAEPARADAPAGAVRIASPVAGLIAEAKAVEGARVEKGAVLFTLDNRVAKAAAEKARQAVGKAREAAKFAEASLQRERTLMKSEGTSQKKLQDAEQQLAAARADLSAAEADLAAAETQLKLLEITAPISGTLVRVNSKAGEVVDTTTVLAELVNLDRLAASVLVASGDLSQLKIGETVEVMAGDATNAVSAQVSFIGAQVDPKTGAGLVRASLPANGGLRLGQVIKARIICAEHKDVLAVPVESVAKDPTGAWFIALVEGEKATLKPVKPGVRDGELVEVEGDGLEADKPVVTAGAYGIIMTQQYATKIREVND